MKNLKKLIPSLLVFGALSVPSFAQATSDSVGTSDYDMVTSDGKVISSADFHKDTKAPLSFDQVDDLSSTVGEKVKPLTKYLKDYQTKVVIGDDDRTKVENTRVAPYNSIAYITFGESSCTGTLIAPNKILTNGHCVYTTSTRSYSEKGSVYPGMNDSTAVNGSANMTEFYVPSGYINTGASQYDFAVIKTDTNIGNMVGYSSIRQVTNLTGTTIKISGYPADKMRSTGKVSQWEMSGRVTKEDTNLAYYTIDTYSGNSGSAMLDQNQQIVGVHNGGYSNETINGGPKATEAFVEFVNYAIAQ
ncbi:trypsin-like serine protease [Bacillus sp. FJAT-53060]|uniref:trypsin-like serine peptidase n=1 Tax=Bacillus TaxID=1386 RepID=UPI001CFA42CF|nr:trypsin-like serine protease [Bacillus stratosphericus]